MSEKVLKREILENLKKGKSKTEIYEEFSPVADDKELRRILASRPAHDTSKGQRIIHKVVCWTWIFVFMVELLSLFDLFVNFDIKVLASFAITTYLLVQLWRFNGDVLLPSIIWLTIGIFNNLRELANIPKDDIDYEAIVIFSWSYTFIMIIAIGLTSLVRKKVFGYYNWFKPAINDQDQIIFQEK
ncbi:MAG: hypothetical protein MJA30_35885 [Cytophagales bacterium]|nr:hypothetical protein [Cytophagales bacterium]